MDLQQFFEAAGGSAAGVIFGAGMVYGWLQAKITGMEKDIDGVSKSCDRAHERIDQVIYLRKNPL